MGLVDGESGIVFLAIWCFDRANQFLVCRLTLCTLLPLYVLFALSGIFGVA